MPYKSATTMKTYNLKPFYTDEEIKAREGQFMTADDYDIVISEDCDAYDDKGQPLFFFRKNKIPTDLCKKAYKALRHAATPTNNRGAAGGLISDETMSAFNKGGEKGKLGVRAIRSDGVLSNTRRANTVNSGIVGYFDRTARFPYCRQTAWYEKNFKVFADAYPYIHYIDKLFKEAVPERYVRQKEMAEKTNKDFIIGDTSFTTVTVNKNFRTALHVDANDYEDGLGNLAVLEAGKYEGGYTVMPKYRVAFDVRSADVCFFNVHEYHANTEIKAKLAYERISVVCYYRKNMHKCLDAQGELDRAKNRKTGEKLN